MRQILIEQPLVILLLWLWSGVWSLYLSQHPSFPELAGMSAPVSGSMRVVGNIIPLRASSSIYRGEADAAS